MRKSLSLLLMLWVGLLVGCGSADMGSVTGTVTLDGKPLAKALLRFEPVNGERASMGETDDNGEYKLEYSLQKSGARVGEHKVTITTAAEPYPDPDSGEYLPARPELLPKKYNIDSELRKTVKGGRNTINFELSSEGDVHQPDYDDQDQ